MTKLRIKPSDRGRNSPEPGPPPGTRAAQRDTEEQLRATAPTGDEAVAWEREEQERLPPRGEGSQHNQGMDRGAGAEAVAEKREDMVAAGRPEGLHTGGTRGPSNQNR